ncbi:MAG: LLM class flavin-dependent oxidoreductase, partial [Actinomycetota bacterium]|nr:LLM class flavin-dependent oxidoreductase [Actinomycetota bacterium]
MGARRMEVGIGLPTRPPLSLARWMLRWARLLRLDSAWAIDHFTGFVPRSLWDPGFTFLARRISTPDSFFDYQSLLGYLASRAGGVRLAVGVTEPIRRHPVLLAQAFLTLSHMTRLPPILGIGAGERENTEPYGLDFDRSVARLEEALQVIRRCFDSSKPFDFQGSFYRLRDASMELKAPAGRAPPIWVAAHGPRMLRLTGRYGDGWYPVFHMTPDEYAAKLDVIRRSAAEAGRPPEAITPGLLLPMVLAGTERAARAMLDARPVRFGALLLPDSIWRLHGFQHPLGAGFRGLVDLVPQQYQAGEVERAISLVPQELLVERVAWGTPEKLLGHIRELGEVG